jgi:hypothetical protein
MSGYTVLRWVDQDPPPLADQLRARPGVKAVVDERLPNPVAAVTVAQLRRLLGHEFEVDCEPVDDGPYGVLYDVTAFYIPPPPEPPPPPRRGRPVSEGAPGDR